MGKKIDFAAVNFLLVDPNPLSVNLTKDILAMLGAVSIRKCTTTDRAIEELRNPVDILITEWNTEPMSGLEFIDFVRHSANSPNRLLPIIMLTARSEPEYVMRARDSGITEFLAKPFTVELLHKRLVSVIARPRPFVHVGNYFGPDRRRRRDAQFGGQDRRQATA